MIASVIQTGRGFPAISISALVINSALPDALAPMQMTAIYEPLMLTGMIIEYEPVMMILLEIFVSCIVVTAMEGVGLDMDHLILSANSVLATRI